MAGHYNYPGGHSAARPRRPGRRWLLPFAAPARYLVPLREQGGDCMTWLFSTFKRSIGKKQLMALTGLGLYLFLIVHLAGNLLVFAGPESFNGYARRLEENPLLIPAEVALLALFVAHVLLALAVTIENRLARPDRYVMKRREGGKTLGSSTMVLTGCLIFVFLVLHLIHFKFASREGTTLYHLVVNTFHQPGYVAWYVFAM